MVSDPGVRDFVRGAIGRDGYRLRVEPTGRAGLRRLTGSDNDLVVVCLELPDLNGVEICRRVRGLQPEVGLIVLVPETGEIDGVAALEAGADDYLVRPARMAELQARVKAVLRRSRRSSAEVADGLELDLSARVLRIQEIEVALTKKEFDLLAVLYLNRDRVVPRADLLDEVWESHWYGSPKALDMHVSSLRRKIAEAGAGDLIRTIRGVGYRLESPRGDGAR